MVVGEQVKINSERIDDIPTYGNFQVNRPQQEVVPYGNA